MVALRLLRLPAIPEAVPFSVGAGREGRVKVEAPPIPDRSASPVSTCFACNALASNCGDVKEDASAAIG
jgi:hypothetical protein